MREIMNQPFGEDVEPFFVAQTAEPMTPDERRRWFEASVEEARARGATWFRFSVHPSIEHLTLIEAWYSRQHDDGPHRWNLEVV